MKNASQNVSNSNGYKFVNKLLLQVQEMQAQSAAMTEMLSAMETKLNKVMESFKVSNSTKADAEQTDTKSNEGVLTKLRAEADKLGLEYHHRTGSVKLQELIDAAKASTKGKRGRPAKAKVEEKSESKDNSKSNERALTKLRAEADKLGLEYHHKAGVAKLQALIDGHKAELNNLSKNRPSKIKPKTNAPA